jgi:hypothetical protein
MQGDITSILLVPRCSDNQIFDNSSVYYDKYTREMERIIDHQAQDQPLGIELTRMQPSLLCVIVMDSEMGSLGRVRVRARRWLCQSPSSTSQHQAQHQAQHLTAESWPTNSAVIVIKKCYSNSRRYLGMVCYGSCIACLQRCSWHSSRCLCRLQVPYAQVGLA